MRTWTIAAGPVSQRTGKGFDLCGACGREIPNGDPVQVITLTGISKRRIRCRRCAVGPVDEAAVDAARLALERRALEQEAEIRPEKLITVNKYSSTPGMLPLSAAAGSLFDSEEVRPHGDHTRSDRTARTRG